MSTDSAACKSHIILPTAIITSAIACLSKGYVFVELYVDPSQTKHDCGPELWISETSNHKFFARSCHFLDKDTIDSGVALCVSYTLYQSSVARSYFGGRFYS